MGVRVNETGDELLETEGVTSLDNILGGEGEEPPAVDENRQEAKPEGGKKDTKKEPDAGEEKELTEEQVAALSPNEKGYYRTMKAERQKRQEAETKWQTERAESTARMKALEEQVNRLLSAVVPQQPKPPSAANPDEDKISNDFWEWENPAEVIDKKVLRHITPLLERFQEVQHLQEVNRLRILGRMARQRYGDFEDMYRVFKADADANPMLYEELIRQEDPAEEAYQYGKRKLEMQQVAQAGGIDKMREKLKAELLAELKQTEEAQRAEEAIQRKLPRSPANMRSTGSAMNKTWEGPTTLDNILAR